MLLQVAFHHRTGWVEHTPTKGRLQSLFHSAHIHELDVSVNLRRYGILYVLAIGSRKDEFLDSLAMSSQYLTKLLAGKIPAIKPNNNTFSLIPPTAVTLPLSVVSPVIAIFEGTVKPVKRET
jgi:hypothetical protein